MSVEELQAIVDNHATKCRYCWNFQGCNEGLGMYDTWERAAVKAGL